MASVSATYGGELIGTRAAIEAAVMRVPGVTSVVVVEGEPNAITIRYRGPAAPGDVAAAADTALPAGVIVRVEIEAIITPRIRPLRVSATFTVDDLAPSDTEP